jgi:hypothetical protein
MQVKGVASVTRREMRAYTCRDTNREVVLVVHACFMTRQLLELPYLFMYLQSEWQRFSSSQGECKTPNFEESLKANGL